MASLFLFITAKKRITVPRIGLVRFGEIRRKKRHIVVAILTASAVFLLALTLITEKGLLAELQGIGAISIIVGMNILIVFSFMAYFLSCTRLYMYAVLLGITEPLSSVLGNKGVLEDPYLLLLIISSGMIVTGAILLVRFMRQYPLKKSEG